MQPTKIIINREVINMGVKFIKLVLVSFVFGILFTGCVWIEHTHYDDTVWVDIYVSDAIVYEGGNTYQALYAELVNEYVYFHETFALDRYNTYRLDYAYECNGIIYHEYLYIDFDDDAEITLYGNELIIEYY